MGADKRLRVAREEAELQRRVDIAEVEERKNTHIQVHKQSGHHGASLRPDNSVASCFQRRQYMLTPCRTCPQDLTKRHDLAFAEIKAYYNDVTTNNLDLVKALKEDAAELRRRETAADKLLAEVAAMNKALVEPLEQVRGAPCADSSKRITHHKLNLVNASLCTQAPEWMQRCYICGGTSSECSVY